MASAAFTIDGNFTPPAVEVSASATVSLALTSTTGVDTIEWEIVGNHSSSATNPTITKAGSPLGATASFTMPSGAGQAYIVKCTVNKGRADEASHLGKVGVVNDAGRLPFALGEELVQHQTYGWTELLNEISNDAVGSQLLAAPADPGDDNKIAVASGGDLTYVNNLTVPGLFGYGGQLGPVNGTREDLSQIADSMAREVISVDLPTTFGNNASISLALIGHIYSPSTGGFIWLGRAHELVVESGSPGSVGTYRILDTDGSGGDKQATISWTHGSEYTVSIELSGNNAVVVIDNQSGDDIFASVTLAYTGTTWS